MNTDLNVLFLGNHTVGVRTLKVLSAHVNVVGVVAHPEDPEDGNCYESVWEVANEMGLPTIRAQSRSSDFIQFVESLSVDLIWITDYKYILPPSVISLPRIGSINLHPSLLPKYRGRAPINWAIINGEDKFGLTAHWVDTGMDTGDIIEQHSYTLSQHEDISDALQKLYPLYEKITASIVLNLLSNRHLGSTCQDHSQSTSYPRRTPQDGLIEWNRPAIEIWNLVRAVAPPYPGAFGMVDRGEIHVLKISSIIPFAENLRPFPGQILSGSFLDDKVIIACADASIVVTSFKFFPHSTSGTN